MTLALTPLSMSTIELLPQPCRSCVFWELDSDAVELAAREGHAAFEKEVWLSGVMLTWGSAGLIVTVDDEPAGFVLFAPPSTVPAVANFPSAPVSADAVLLTALRIDQRFAGRGVGRHLVLGAAAALARRGVRALETFGRETSSGRADPPPGRHLQTDPPSAGLNTGAQIAHSQADRPSAGLNTGAQIAHCTIPAGFARAVGFTEVRPHRRYPRLRMELSGELGWKAEVEAALDRLTEVIPAGAGRPVEYAF